MPFVLPEWSAQMDGPVSFLKPMPSTVPGLGLLTGTQDKCCARREGLALSLRWLVPVAMQMGLAMPLASAGVYSAECSEVWMRCEQHV